MSFLEVTFPDEWQALRGPSHVAVTRPVAPGGWVHGSGPATSAPLRALAEPDVDDLALLVLPEEPAGAGIQAFCAIGVVHHFTGSDAELRAVAEGSPHAGLERDTLTVEFSLGRVVRSSAFRFVDEPRSDELVGSFAAEIRFALPLPGRRIGVLHFETLSLRGFEELESLFDTIAGTARIA